MLFVPKIPKKIQYLLEFSYPQINLFCPRKPFIGGRIGHSKELLFVLLLIKKVTNWDYITLLCCAGGLLILLDGWGLEYLLVFILVLYPVIYGGHYWLFNRLLPTVEEWL